MMRFVLKSKIPLSSLRPPSSYFLPHNLSSQRRPRYILSSPKSPDKATKAGPGRRCRPRSRFPYSRKGETKSTRCHHPHQPPCRHEPRPSPRTTKIPSSMHRSLARLGLQHWVLRVASFRIRLGAVVLRKKGGGETNKANNNQRPKRGGRITQNPSARQLIRRAGG